MTLQEIKQAIDDGKSVFWKNQGYKVIKDNIGQYLIIRDDYCIGLTWRNGVTMNGKEEDFFTA